VVIGYGSVSRGAIYALQGRGFNNIHVYTQRPTHLVADQIPDVYYHHLHLEKDGSLWSENQDGSLRPFIEILSDTDIICNGILQDTDNPLMFVDENNVRNLKPRSVIVDISCDKGMGFSFARPTTFDNPVFTAGENVTYYSVDHTSTYLWNAASREISKAVLQYLPIVVNGPDAWIREETIRRAIEIKDGVIQNPKILSFQKRNREYPHSFVL
jgi:alanine dehydrogenase